MRGGGGAFRDPVARAKAERDNDRAAVGERIAAYREAGATWQRAATRECINRDAARVCFAPRASRSSRGHAMYADMSTNVASTIDRRSSRMTATAAQEKLGTITIPRGCRPSMVCDCEGTRPVITHAYLHRREDDLWLLATDSYIACAIRVEEDNARDGWVPIGALRLMEQDEAAVQVSNTAWSVYTHEGTITFDVAPQLGEDATFPITAVEPLLWGDHTEGPVSDIRLDPALTVRLAEALGANMGCDPDRPSWSVRLEFAGPLKPIRVTAGGDAGGRIGAQMPVKRLRLES